MLAFGASVIRSLRSLGRSPFFVATMILSVGLAVGASTTVFIWMNGLVLNPFPAVADPTRLVGLEAGTPTGRGLPLSFPTFRDWRNEARSFSGMAAWSMVRVSARTETHRAASPLLAVVASGDYFATLGVGAMLGRTLAITDEREAAPVAVLGHSYWQRELAGDSAVVGRTLFLNGQPVSIIGVAASRFAGTYVGVVPDVFVPITIAPQLSQTSPLEDRTARWVQAFARLAPGVRLEQAARELDVVARRLSASYGERPVTGAIVMDARMQYLGRLIYPLFTAMLIITGLLLAIAAANLGGLMLMRADRRRHEMALRLALGASRVRLLAATTLECLALTASGGALGVLVAVVGRGLLYELIPSGPFPIMLPLAIDGRVLLFATGASMAVALVCAFVSVRGTLQVSPANVLRTASGSVSRAGGGARLLLLVGQIAFSLLCLTSAALFVRSLRRAAAVDVGFSDPDRVLLVNTDFANARLDRERGVTALRGVLERVRALPGVRSASAATTVPLGFGGRRAAEVRVDGYVPEPNETMTVERVLIGSDYARTMGIRVITGRSVAETDASSTVPVAVVNQTFARRFWPNGTALGQRIDAGRGWATVVGVLGDGKYADLDEPPRAVAYFPLAQWFQPAVTVHVRVADRPRALVEPVRDALRRVHPDLPALQARTLAEHASAATFVPRVGTTVLGAFSIAALFLAGLGVYGAVSAAAVARTREIGIRIALGAPPRAIAYLVLRRTLVVATLGVGVGAATAVVVARALSATVPGLDPRDITAFAGAAAALLLALSVAGVVPVRRAWRTDTVVILRSE